MRRLVISLGLLAVLLGVLRVAAPAPAPASAAQAYPVLEAFVGPGYDIALRDDSGDVRGRQIPAGTYQVEVFDYSEIHNFELKGDGVDMETEEEFTGRQTWIVTFVAGGRYEFECDPHHDVMFGSFTAGAGAPSPPPPPPPPPPPSQAGGTLVATVRPDYTIDLKHPNGAPVTQVAPGSYTIEVNDQAPQHNFHLTGPGVDQATTVGGTGTVTWTVSLTEGTYTFVCDPHADGMRGSFAVAAGAAPPAPPPPPPPPAPPAAPPPPQPGQSGGTLVATVRPDYTIDVKHPNGAAVTHLASGTYTIEVHDQAPQHNFHLTGPGVDRATTVEGTGTTTWALTLAPGTYTFVCDPHAEGMRGSFTVADGPAPPPPPAAVAPAPKAPAAPGVLIATVRSNYTIDLRLPSGAKADSLQAGAYTVEVRDQTKDHNFHLTGPGVNKATTVPFVGTAKWALVLKPGAYRFLCDPHAPVMKGTVTVTAGPPKPLKVSSLRVTRVGRHVLVRMRVNKGVRAKIRLLRQSRAVASLGAPLKAGANVKRLRLPARAPRGLYRVQIVLVDGVKRQTLTRRVRL